MVIPALAGIQAVPLCWIPASAGMTCHLCIHVPRATFKRHNTLQTLVSRFFPTFGREPKVKRHGPINSTSETYIGTLYYGKTERIASHTNPDHKTWWRLKPKDEWIAIPVPAIIDDTTWQAAQLRREQNARTSPRNRTALSSFVTRN